MTAPTHLKPMSPQPPEPENRRRQTLLSLVAVCFVALSSTACEPDLSSCCSSDGECADGATCREGQCTPRCTETSGCFEGQTCIQGACLFVGRPESVCWDGEFEPDPNDPEPTPTPAPTPDPAPDPGVTPEPGPPPEPSPFPGVQPEPDGPIPEPSPPPEPPPEPTPEPGPIPEPEPGVTCPDQFEPNDSRGLATEGIANTGTYSLAICDGDEDFFRVDAGPGDVIRVEIQFSDNNGDLDLWLTDAEGQPLDRSESTRDEETIEYFVEEPGTHYARVYGFSNDSGPYTITITSSDNGNCTEDFFEPNNSRQQASSISAEGQLDATLCPTDVDFYRFEPADMNRSVITTLNFPFVDSYEIRVRVGNGSRTFNAGAGFFNLEFIPADIGAGNQVLIRLSLTQPPADPFSPYTMALTPGDDGMCIDDTFEDNDSLDTAIELNAFTSIGATACPGDADFFFYAPVSPLTRLQFTQFGGDLGIAVFNIDTQEVLFVRDGGNVDEIIDIEFNEVFIVVTAQTDEPGDYLLEIGP